jgi:hypothetical protein
MSTCTMPGCTRPPTTNNRAQQPTCAGHKTVVVSGSWVGDKHLEPEGDSQ